MIDTEVYLSLSNNLDMYRDDCTTNSIMDEVIDLLEEIEINIDIDNHIDVVTFDEIIHEYVEKTTTLLDRIQKQ